MQTGIGNYQPEWIGKSEIDVFIPSLSIGIEYDGRVWHKNIEKDRSKNEIFQSHGIRLIRLREPGIESINEDCILLTSLKTDALSAGINSVLKQLGVETADVIVDRDIDDVYALMDYHGGDSYSDVCYF